jgi:hypothetical protein
MISLKTRPRRRVKTTAKMAMPPLAYMEEKKMMECQMPPILASSTRAAL